MGAGGGLCSRAESRQLRSLRSQSLQTRAKLYILHIYEVTTMTTAAQKPLLLNFKQESLTTVSRKSLKELAKKLGFDETQTVLFALARLRDEVLVSTDSSEKDTFMPLTPSQHKKIAAAAPAKRGKVVDTLIP